MGTDGEKTKIKRFRTLRSLNITLWLIFSLFGTVLVLVLAIIYHSLASRTFFDRANEDLFGARDEIVSYLEAGDTSDIDTVAYHYGVGGVYLLYEEESNVVVYVGDENRTKQSLDVYSDAFIEEGLPVFDWEEKEMILCESLTLNGRAGRLYLTLSLAPIDSYQNKFGLVSILASLAAVVAAFAVGGLLSTFISRPVSEVTEEAKELARGSFDLNIRKDYFFSEIAELSEALDTAKREMSKADRVQRELISNVSHDFKTPLTMIKAYASMIREISGDNKEKRDAHAQIIIDEADRLSALVSDVLDLSKIKAGGIEERTVFDLSEDVKSIVSRFDYLAETQGYKIETVIDDGLEVNADRSRIGQVVYNLVGNAVNYTGEDKRVRVKLYKKENAARLEVIDSGKGIPPDEVDTIWDRYYRSESTHKRPVRGTGLGLSIVKNILLQHASPFGVVSEVGKGSCFWAEFPLNGMEDKEEQV